MKLQLQQDVHSEHNNLVLAYTKYMQIPRLCAYRSYNVNYPVSTCSVDTHNTITCSISSGTLTNHCGTLMDIQSMATMYVSCKNITSIFLNS